MLVYHSLPYYVPLAPNQEKWLTFFLQVKEKLKIITQQKMLSLQRRQIFEIHGWPSILKKLITAKFILIKYKKGCYQLQQIQYIKPFSWLDIPLNAAQYLH